MNPWILSTLHIYWCASFTVVVEKGRNLSRKRRRGRISRNLARIRRITPHQSRPSTMFNVCSKRAGISQPRSSLSVVQASEDPELNCVKNVWWAFGLAAELCTPILKKGKSPLQPASPHMTAFLGQHKIFWNKAVIHASWTAWTSWAWC